MATESTNLIESIIPYARSIPVKLRADGLAPNKKMYVFINGIMCNAYIFFVGKQTGAISRIEIKSTGNNYVQATTKVNFIGANTRTAKAAANVVSGKVVGIDISDYGSGYNANSYVTITGVGSGATANCYFNHFKGVDLITDAYGSVEFQMYVPNDQQLKFPSGTLIFTISDHPTNPNFGSSSASCKFLSNGILKETLITKTETVYNYTERGIEKFYLDNSTGNFTTKSTPTSKTPTDQTPIIRTNPWVLQQPGNYNIFPDTKITVDEEPTANLAIDVVNTGTITTANTGTTANTTAITLQKYKGESITVGASVTNLGALDGVSTIPFNGAIDSNFILTASGGIVLNGMANQEDAVIDGRARTDIELNVPQGFIVTEENLKALSLSIQNLNGRDSTLGNPTISIEGDSSTGIKIKLSQKAKETQNYDASINPVNIALQLTPDYTNYADNFVEAKLTSNGQTITLSTVNDPQAQESLQKFIQTQNNNNNSEPALNSETTIKNSSKKTSTTPNSLILNNGDVANFHFNTEKAATTAKAALDVLRTATSETLVNDVTTLLEQLAANPNNSKNIKKQIKNLITSSSTLAPAVEKRLIATLNTAANQISSTSAAVLDNITQNSTAEQIVASAPNPFLNMGLTDFLSTAL